jgi:TolB-like protein/DNA-binding winged helix-turn-helix (wHTH) protein
MPAILPAPAVSPGSEPMPAIVGGNNPVKIGDWLADPRDDSLTRGAEKVKIEPRTMRLLMRLAQTPGVVVSQDELLESVWSGVVVGTASIYQSMSQLRKVLGDNEDPPRYLETVARKGYRLVAPVSLPPSTAPPPGTASDPVAVAAAFPAAAGADVPPARRVHWSWLGLVALAALAVLVAVWRFAPRGESPPESQSIAVLPFIDLSGGQSEQAFCDGLTEETSNWLAQVPTLRVVARTSAFSYRNRSVDVRTIGRELRTRHLLEGSLRRSGNQLRITVQLIDATTGYHLWSRSYDVQAGDDFSLQEQIARAVVGNLELRMTADDDRHFADRRSRSAEAQRLYLNAKGHAQKFDGPSNEQAISLYREALKVDPSFALAKVWLAQAIANRRYFAATPIEELSAEIEPLLADVAKSSPGLSDLYAVRGGYLIELRRREPALRDLNRALELSPNSRLAASALGFYHLTAAEPRQALKDYTLAADLDPRVFGMHVYRCIALTDLGEFSQAEAACGQARALDPESPWPYSVSSSMEAMRGRLVEALRWSDAAVKRGDDVMAILLARAQWLLSLGLPGEAGAAYEHAVAKNAAGTRDSPEFVFVGASVAVDKGGAAALRDFVRDNGLLESTNAGVLFSLASAALMAHDASLARQFVDRALASKTLQPEDLASPWLARTGQSYLLIAAVALRGSGAPADAEQRLDQLTTLLARLEAGGVRTIGLFELRAQLAALRGQGDAAMSELQRAAALGWYDAWLADHQPYYSSLRGRADFERLLAAVRARNAATAASLRERLLTAGTR